MSRLIRSKRVVTALTGFVIVGGLACFLAVNLAFLQLCWYDPSASKLLGRIGAPLENAEFHELSGAKANEFVAMLKSISRTADLPKFARANFIAVIIMDNQENCVLRLRVRSRDDGSEWSSRDDILKLALQGPQIPEALAEEFYEAQGSSCATYNLVVR